MNRLLQNRWLKFSPIKCPSSSVSPRLVRRPFSRAGRSHPLQPMFSPSTVAVVGATNRPKTVGRTVLWNLLNNPFGGAVYPVSPSSANILGVKAYKSVREVPEPVDLAVIVTPSKTIPAIVQECVDSGVRGAIIISAGFKEVGPEGEKLQDECLRIAKDKLRILGPNCLGIMNPVWGLNATFASKMALPGNIGFISQSGAFCTAVLDWSLSQNVGFSSFVSVGGLADVDWGDLIYYLGNDPNTKSILMYMESIGNAQSFISAAREVSLVKPIIVIKGGRTEGAASAASSHTGALAGSDDVVDAAFRRCGVLRVSTVEELFYLSDVLCKQPRPKGNRLTILTNAGGPAILAADNLISGEGELAPLSEPVKAQLSKMFPAGWSSNNPVDILGTSKSENYARAFKTIAKENTNSDGTLLVFTPSQYADPTNTAEAIAKTYKEIKNEISGPILTSFIGGDSCKNANRILNSAGIPTIEYPDLASTVWNYMWRYSSNLSQIYETPRHLHDTFSSEVTGKVKAMLEEIRNSGRTILTEHEAKQVFEMYGIATSKTYLAENEEEAAQFAKQIGFPVVLKINSKTVTHKSDVGGVKLNLKTEEAVKLAFQEIKGKIAPADFHGATVQKMANLSSGYELIIGSSIDPQIGPVLLFGAGGTMVEVNKDTNLGLPPLNTTLALRMVEGTKIYKALQGFRGKKAVNIDKLCELLVRCSDLIVQQPIIQTFDVNPLLISSSEMIALDARIILHEKEVTQYPIPAIRPYPTQYIHEFNLPDGQKAIVRPILPDDEPLLVKFNSSLSEDATYLRYFHTVSKSQLTSHEILSRMCFLDFNREIGLVVETGSVDNPEIVALAQLARSKNGLNEAEFSIIISCPYDQHGLSTLLLKDLVHIAKCEKIGRVRGSFSSSNSQMKNVAIGCGFSVHIDEQEGLINAELDLEK